MYWYLRISTKQVMMVDKEMTIWRHQRITESRLLSTRDSDRRLDAENRRPFLA